MNRRETTRILAAVREAQSRGERVALATVVRVTGSAYRREGATMVVLADGRYECMLSGGCLEPTVVETARQVIATGEPVVTRYDLAEDVVWGLGIGCSGTVDIRIERLEDDPISRAWLDCLERALPAVLATALSGPPGRLLVPGTGDVAGQWGDPARGTSVVARASALLEETDPRSRTERLGDADVFYQVSAPVVDLVIFGAGHDAIPVARLAQDLGLAVTVVDVREAYLTEARFPGARLVGVEIGRLPEALALGPRSFALVMHHHLARDREALRFALGTPARYVGVLGPRARLGRLLADLEAEGFVPPPHALERVHSPVGLALGAESPEEVAVSILAEVMAVRRGFRGGFLTRHEGGIHAPPEARLLARS